MALTKTGWINIGALVMGIGAIVFVSLGGDDKTEAISHPEGDNGKTKTVSRSEGGDGKSKPTSRIEDSKEKKAPSPRDPEKWVVAMGGDAKYVNEKVGENGDTLVHLAAREGRVDMLDWLKEKGADIKRWNGDDLKQTPMEVAAEEG